MNARVQGLLQAIGVGVYCLLIGIFMESVGKMLPGPDSPLSGVVFLLLFCASALITALIVFYKPYKLFFAGKKTEAIETVMYTALGVFILAVVGFLSLILLK